MGEITDKLDKVLGETKFDDADEVLASHWEDMIENEDAFTQYMKSKFREKGLRNLDIYPQAVMGDKKFSDIISRQKNTKDRDIIIRICIAAQFSLEETNHALELYGMNPLYSRNPRDVVFILAINNRVYDLFKIDDRLEAEGFDRIIKEEK